MDNTTGWFKRLFKGIIPTARRAAEGTYTTFVVHGVGLLGAASKKLVGATGTPVWNGYGAVAALLAATGNLTDAWVEALVVHTPSSAKVDFLVALTSAAAITAAAQIEAEVPVHVGAVTDELVIPVKPPAFFPAGTLIGAALQSAIAGGTAGKSLNVWAVISRRRD